MSEVESGASDTAGGGGSIWTSLPALLTASAVLLGAIVSAVVTLRDDDGPAQAAATTAVEPEDGPFAAVTRPSGRVYFDGDTMFVKASRPGRPMLALAESEEALGDVRVSALAERVSGAGDYGLGFVCRYADAGNYYLLSVLSGGRYNVVRYRRGKPVSLTGGMRTSAAIEGGANEVVARCVGSGPVLLTLTVNGRELASVQDADGIASGNVGVRVGTSESVVTCSFRDVELRSL